MRIITGTARGCKLRTLDSLETRPTPEKVKEAVFSAIQFDIAGRHALDLFAGSGQLGLEALSRGAEHCTFIDSGRDACAIIRENAQKARLYGQSSILCSDWERYIISATGKKKFGLVFLDPPYSLRLLPRVLSKLSSADVLTDDCIIVCEDENKGLYEGEVERNYTFVKESRYGRVVITYLKPVSPES